MGKSSRGVIIGFSRVGLLAMYEISPNDTLNHRGNYYLDDPKIAKIHSIEIAPDDMYAVIDVVFQNKSQGSSLLEKL